jgi:hypothetical protein
MTKYEFKRFQSLEEPALHVAEGGAEYYNFRYIGGGAIRPG